MHTQDRLKLAKEIDARNAQRLEDWKNTQKGGESMSEPKYTLTRAEREVTIRFDAEERIAHIYTSDPVYIRRLDKLCEEDPDTYKCVEVDRLGYYKKYEAPADRIAFRKSPTEARREAGRQHMQRMQQKP